MASTKTPIIGSMRNGFIGLFLTFSFQNLEGQRTNISDSLLQKINIPKPFPVNQTGKENVLKFVNDSDFLRLQPRFRLSLPVRKFRLGGEMSLEAFHTDFQNPRSLNERQYIRLSGQNELSILGLPFTGNFYFTTEDNRIYNTNTVNIRFDKEQFYDMLQSQALEQLNAYKSELSSMNKGLNKQQFQLATIKRQMDLQKRNFQYDSSLMNNHYSTWQTELNTELDILSIKFKDSTGKLLDSSSYLRKCDSLNQRLELKKRNIQKRMKQSDSLYRDAHEKYDMVQKKIESLEKEISRARSFVQKADSIASEPELILSNAIGAGKEVGIMKQLAHVESLDIGNINPTCGEMMMAGLPARGLNVAYNNRFIVKAAVGKTIDNPLLISPSERTKGMYNRNLILTGLGFQSKRGFSILNFLSLWDNPVNSSNPEANVIIGLENEYKLGRHLSFASESFISQYRRQNQSVQASSDYQTTARFNNRLLDKAAIAGKLAYAVTKSTNLNVKIKQLGTLLHNLANPFLRRDYRELKFSIEQSLFDKKIHLAAFHMTATDNLRKLNSFTNRTDGLGFQLNTAFLRIPNISVSYTPFTQGVLHPDSLLRTNNQYATKTGSVSYQWHKGKTRFNTSGTFTEGLMQFGDEGQKLYNRSIQFMSSMYAKKISSTVQYAKSFNEGMIDTLSFDMFSLSANVPAGKKVSFGFQTQYALFANGGERLNHMLNFKLKYNNRINMRLQTGYTRIKKIWGISEDRGFTGSAQVNVKI